MIKKRNKLNLNILIPIVLLSIISIISIYSAGIYTDSNFGNLAIKQMLWYIVCFIIIIYIYTRTNIDTYKYSLFLYVLGNILLLGLLVFGVSINGSKCWYKIPGIGNFQPSEFMKLFLILYLSYFINSFRNKYENPTIVQELLLILKSLLIVLIPSVLTFLEPDTGAVILYLVIYVVMMFTSGIRKIWGIVFIGVVVLSFMFLYNFYNNEEDKFIDVFGINTYYRINRILNWKEQSGMQLNNSIYSIGSAGYFGYGIRKTPIYIPEASTDFIFTIYASSFGYVGVVILFIIMIYLDISILVLYRIKKYRYLISGVFAVIIFQQVQNISMTIGLLPITGITLPFISYGGSSLLSYMIIIGLLLNFSKNKIINS